MEGRVNESEKELRRGEKRVVGDGGVLWADAKAARARTGVMRVLPNPEGQAATLR
jgi:hypothetical protein